MVTLREVLNRFARQSGTASLNALACELEIDPAILQDMVDYWVRKGRLHEVADPACTTCGCARGCPFVFTLPRAYEFVREDSAEPAVPVCPRCGAHP